MRIMRKLILAVLFLTVVLVGLVGFAFAASTETVFPWKVLRGSPRSATPLQTAEQVAKWLLGPGKGDLGLVTSSEDATKAVVLLEQSGAKALGTIRVKPGNLVSEDNGVSWQVAEFRNIVFGTNQAVVFKGPLSVEWVNYAGGVAYYPAGLDSEWVPVVQGACGNLYLWRRPRKPTPPEVTGLVLQFPQPTPSPTPTPIVPGAPGKAYNRVERVQETRSEHTVATIGEVPVPKLQVTNSANNTNVNTLMSELLNNIVSNNVNVNVNTNTLNAILQQLQQLVVSIAIGG